ncbi:MAG: hypothetical protein WBQ75_12950 [Acetobacteraceae bacterium]
MVVAAGLGFLAAKQWKRRSPDAEDLVEVGAIGADLRYWRAKEALRHGELRMGVQAQATQALEARATAMLGWSVAGVLALGAAIVNGTHAIAAGTAATCLFAAAVLCIVAITSREWSGPGYRPEVVLNDRSGSELEAIESLVIGYQQAVQRNHEGFRKFETLLYWALACIVAAPILGAAALLLAWYWGLPIQV